eukprot:5011628-Amphidinium_carterae.1
MRLNRCSNSTPVQPSGQSHISALSTGQYPPSSEASSSPASQARTEIAESRIHTLGYLNSPLKAS